MRSGFWMPLPAATSRQLLGAIRDRVSPGFTVYGVLAPATPAKPTRPTVAMAAAAAARRRIRVRKGMSFCWGNPPQLDARTPGHGRWFPVRRPCRRAQRRPQGRGGQCPTTYRHQGPPCVRSGDYSLPPLSSLFRNLRRGLPMSSLWDVDNETTAEPLVGRAETIAGLEARLFGPEPRGVVLAGAPGAGRTAVARELVCRAGEHGVDPVLVTATRAAARVPLGAVAPLLPAGAPAGAADGDQASLLRGTLDALAERARDRRLLVVVDDAHLLDDVSATLVHHVAADGTAVVLATVRAREPAPDPLVALWKDELCERVELHPLDAEGTGELVREVLGGAVDPASVVQLVARSQGNVLFLRELVAAAVDDGRLHDDGGIWRLEGELTPSARLIELVEATDLAGLGDDERALLEVVSLGEPVGATELAALADASLAEDLERRGLLAGELDGDRVRVHIAHPLVGDVVRARIPALRARAIAEKLAGVAEDCDPTDHDDVLRLATLGLSTGEPDPDVLLDGAAIARDRSDLPRAEALARAAADAGAGFDATLLAAQVAALQGRVEEAEADLTALMAGAADDRERSRAALALFDTAVVWSARDDGDLLGRAAAAVDDPAWRDRVAARQLALVVLAEGPRAALDATADLPTGGDPQAREVARLVRADALVRTGRLDEALALTDADPASPDQAAATREDPTWSPWWHAATRASALVHAGRYAEADELAAGHHASALARG